MSRMAVKGQWRDDEITLNAGGLKRKEPNWDLLTEDGARAAVDEREEQRALHEKNADRLAEIYNKLRNEKNAVGSK